MKNCKRLIPLFVLSAVLCVQALMAAPALRKSTAPLKHDSIKAAGGSILITPLFHAGVQFEYRGNVIIVDPLSAAALTRKADVILITHTHPDHLDPAALRKLARVSHSSKDSTVVVAPEAAIPIISKIKTVRVRDLHNGGWTRIKTNSGLDVTVEAVPAYNIKRGPKPGTFYHPKGQFNGYVLTLGGKRIYIAGDTEPIPEMKNLKHIDAAFLPMNLPFTMTPAEAAVAATSFMPKIVYPYHFRYPYNVANDNPQKFARALKGSGIAVRILDFYPPAAVARAMQAAG